MELGTHTGNSYAAFAQAIETLGLPTASYAVDTWRGDPHTRFYDEASSRSGRRITTADLWPFRVWSDRHLPKPSSTSPMAASTCCTSTGITPSKRSRRTSELWRPKMSNRGVVLLHDINVREREFGVWRLWEQLREQYPSFAFLHGHGLGVLGLGI